jgi:hypothetical protein
METRIAIGRMTIVQVLVAAAVTGCSHPAPPPAGPVEHRLTPEENWGANSLGCTPRGPELTIEGMLVVRPFGKGTDGAVIKTDTGDEWIVTYRAEGATLDLEDRRVIARGRECDKEGQSMAGKHFDLATLTEVPAA